VGCLAVHAVCTGQRPAPSEAHPCGTGDAARRPRRCRNLPQKCAAGSFYARCGKHGRPSSCRLSPQSSPPLPENRLALDEGPVVYLINIRSVSQNQYFVRLTCRAKKSLREGAPAYGGRQSTIMQPLMV